jgi:Uma2 family endonuclease
VGTGAQTSRFSEEEYLAWEREQPERHEWCAGDVFAMAGGSPRHNYLSGTVFAALLAELRGSACRPLSSDQRVYLPSTTQFVYPDATVVCGTFAYHASTRDVVTNPSLVVEVLSKSTEQHDRGLKWEGYRQIATLNDFLLVSQRIARVESYTREEDGWLYRVAGAGQSVVLTGGRTLSVDAIFDGAFDLDADE